MSEDHIFVSDDGSCTEETDIFRSISSGFLFDCKSQGRESTSNAVAKHFRLKGSFVEVGISFESVGFQGLRPMEVLNRYKWQHKSGTL